MTANDIILFLLISFIFSCGLMTGFFYGQMRLLKDQRKEIEEMKNSRFVISIPMEKGEAARNAEIVSNLFKIIELEEQKENQNDTNR